MSKHNPFPQILKHLHLVSEILLVQAMCEFSFFNLHFDDRRYGQKVEYGKCVAYLIKLDLFSIGVCCTSMVCAAFDKSEVC